MKLLVGLYSFVPLFWVVNTRSLNSVSPDPCHIDAWVRAPDLDPGQVIPGQVRIKTNGTCDPISEYSLILRFKERAWVKLPKPDIILPQEPDRQFIYDNISQIDRNNVFKVSDHFFARDPSWGKYVKDISDPSLWDIVEEERIAFESRYKLNEAITPFLLGKGVTHNFALLVPTTDYPPTPWNDFVITSRSRTPTTEKGDEYIYLYTVEIKFDNGTIVEIPAGYTAFNTVGRSDDHEPEVVTANFTQRFIYPSSNSNLSLTINVTFPHGRTLEQG
ncbi:hypothetical protein Clacol_007387 [Clathrus columnatus]|uniref:Uncharacterized protein n=1 Tax=Clathrus columnatus TaxID=1419009 RepID=A0AAV5AHL3_9AGAM|nr:hypothetical protein Clacol_007387 [Clathrus columnatus]